MIFLRWKKQKMLPGKTRRIFQFLFVLAVRIIPERYESDWEQISLTCY